MTKDYTAEIAELDAAYQANRVANATIAIEVRNRYRSIIAAEIATLKAENDKKFADHLARVKERSGMPVGIIQDHVLHTRAWNRWLYWRDLAEIPGERVSVRNAREERQKENAAFLWSDDYATLTVRKNTRGEDIEPVVYDMSTNSQDAAGRWWPDATDQIHEREVARDDRQFLRALHDEIQRQIDEGNVPE